MNSFPLSISLLVCSPRVKFSDEAEEAAIELLGSLVQECIAAMLSTGLSAVSSISFGLAENYVVFPLNEWTDATMSQITTVLRRHVTRSDAMADVAISRSQQLLDAVKRATAGKNARSHRTADSRVVIISLESLPLLDDATTNAFSELCTVAQPVRWDDVKELEVLHAVPPSGSDRVWLLQLDALRAGLPGTGPGSHVATAAPAAGVAAFDRQLQRRLNERRAACSLPADAASVRVLHVPPTAFAAASVGKQIACSFMPQVPLALHFAATPDSLLTTGASLAEAGLREQQAAAVVQWLDLEASVPLHAAVGADSVLALSAWHRRALEAEDVATAAAVAATVGSEAVASDDSSADDRIGPAAGDAATAAQVTNAVRAPARGGGRGGRGGRGSTSAAHSAAMPRPGTKAAAAAAAAAEHTALRAAAANPFPFPTLLPLTPTAKGIPSALGSVVSGAAAGVGASSRARAAPPQAASASGSSSSSAAGGDSMRRDLPVPLGRGAAAPAFRLPPTAHDAERVIPAVLEQLSCVPRHLTAVRAVPLAALQLQHMTVGPLRVQLAPSLQSSLTPGNLQASDTSAGSAAAASMSVDDSELPVGPTAAATTASAAAIAPGRPNLRPQAAFIGTVAHTTTQQLLDACLAADVGILLHAGSPQQHDHHDEDSSYYRSGADSGQGAIACISNLRRGRWYLLMPVAAAESSVVDIASSATSASSGDKPQASACGSGGPAAPSAYVRARAAPYALLYGLLSRERMMLSHNVSMATMASEGAHALAGGPGSAALTLPDAGIASCLRSFGLMPVPEAEPQAAGPLSRGAASMALAPFNPYHCSDGLYEAASSPHSAEAAALALQASDHHRHDGSLLSHGGHAHAAKALTLAAFTIGSIASAVERLQSEADARAAGKAASAVAGAVTAAAAGQAGRGGARSRAPGAAAAAVGQLAVSGQSASAPRKVGASRPLKIVSGPSPAVARKMAEAQAAARRAQARGRSDDSDSSSDGDGDDGGSSGNEDDNDALVMHLNLQQARVTAEAGGAQVQPAAATGSRVAAPGSGRRTAAAAASEALMTWEQLTTSSSGGTPAAGVSGKSTLAPLSGQRATSAGLPANASASGRPAATTHAGGHGAATSAAAAAAVRSGAVASESRPRAGPPSVAPQSRPQVQAHAHAQPPQRGVTFAASPTVMGSQAGVHHHDTASSAIANLSRTVAHSSAGTAEDEDEEEEDGPIVTTAARRAARRAGTGGSAAHASGAVAGHAAAQTAGSAGTAAAPAAAAAASASNYAVEDIDESFVAPNLPATHVAVPAVAAVPGVRAAVTAAAKAPSGSSASLRSHASLSLKPTALPANSSRAEPASAARHDGVRKVAGLGPGAVDHQGHHQDDDAGLGLGLSAALDEELLALLAPGAASVAPDEWDTLMTRRHSRGRAAGPADDDSGDRACIMSDRRDSVSVTGTSASESQPTHGEPVATGSRRAVATDSLASLTGGPGPSRPQAHPAPPPPRHAVPATLPGSAAAAARIPVPSLTDAAVALSALHPQQPRFGTARAGTTSMMATDGASGSSAGTAGTATSGGTALGGHSGGGVRRFKPTAEEVAALKGHSLKLPVASPRDGSSGGSGGAVAGVPRAVPQPAAAALDFDFDEL